MNIIKLLLLAIIVCMFACCSNDVSDVIVENNAFKEKQSFNDISLNTYSKAFYAVSALGRIEDQIINNPSNEKIDFGKLRYTIDMLEHINQSEAYPNTKDIISALKNNKYTNREQSLEKDSSDYRKMMLYSYSVILLLAEKSQTKALLTNFAETYRPFVLNNKSKFNHFRHNKNITRSGSGLGYNITLITPIGKVQSFCPYDTYILDAAEEEGIDLPYSSRNGSDYISAGKLIAGTVQMDDNILTEELVQQGYILLDVAYPTADCIIETHKEDELYSHVYELEDIVVIGHQSNNEENSDIEMPDSSEGLDWESIIEGGTSGDSGGLVLGGGSLSSDSNGLYNNYHKLTEEEKDFIKKHPVAAIKFKNNAERAYQETVKIQKKYGYDGSLGYNGILDCFRHTVWSAFNAYDQGYDLAKEFGDAHESDPSNPTDEKDMDLYNNQLGYQIGIDAKSQGYSFDDIPGLVETAVIYQGKGRILKGTR